MTAVEAWSPEGVVPLELWDVVVDGRSLFARRDEPSFFASLTAAALAVREGRARREGGARLPACAWESVVVVGGAVDEARARKAFESHEVTLDCVSRDPFFTALTAHDALARAGADEHAANPAVIDVGQTAMKALGPCGSVLLARGAGSVDRTTFAALIADAIHAVCGDSLVSPLVLALPCEVTFVGGAIVLGASTYPTEGDGDALVSLVLSSLVGRGAPSSRIMLVNDAVLMGWAFARQATPPRPRLVLTVGLGVGAAFTSATA